MVGFIGRRDTTKETACLLAVCDRFEKEQTDEKLRDKKERMSLVREKERKPVLSREGNTMD